MKADDFQFRLQALDRTCEDLEQRLSDLRRALVDVQRLRVEGQTVSEILASGPGLARRHVQDSVSIESSAT